MKVIQCSRLSFLSLCWLLVFVYSSNSCSVEPSFGIEKFKSKRTGEYVHIVNWNVQTFFDAHAEGTEYSDFYGSKSIWDQGRYETRLKNLCSFILNQDADIYVFEEVENESVLQDVSNFLPALNRGKNPWQYACFAKQVGAALGCAVLSRLPIETLNIHQIDERIFSFEISSLRPLLEISIGGLSKKLHVFVCHWKSKYNDINGNTSIIRRLQEKLLTERLLSQKKSDPVSDFFICGDFNQELCDFYTNWDIKSQKTGVIMLNLRGADESIPVFSPWPSYPLKGSYYYNESWEKIDHFFYSSGIEISSFRVLDSGEHVKDGLPFRYELYSNTGFSDHLPLSCWIRFTM